MPFLHIERYESIAHCGELLSATRGVLFVLKTPFFAKKIQKHEILPCNKLLFSLSVQNEEISYKNSWFRIFLYGIHLFGGICDKLTWELVKQIHERPRRTEHHALMSRLRVWIFYEKRYSSSNPHGHGSSCHPWQRPPVVNLLFTPPCLSALFKKISTPSDRHRGMTFRPPWAFCFFGSMQKNWVVRY